MTEEPLAAYLVRGDDAVLRGEAVRTLVRVERDEVQGTIAPYWDPDCNCRAQTEFEGKVSGDEIPLTVNGSAGGQDFEFQMTARRVK